MQRPSIVENFDLCYLFPVDTEDIIRISPKRVAYQVPSYEPQYKDEKPPADALFIVFLRRDSGFLLFFPAANRAGSYTAHIDRSCVHLLSLRPFHKNIAGTANQFYLLNKRPMGIPFFPVYYI